MGRRVELSGRSLRVGDRLAASGRTVTAITRDTRAQTLTVIAGGRVFHWRFTTPLIVERR